MKLVLCFLLLLIGQIAICQYEPFKSQGDIPKDFTTPSHIKYEKAKDNVDRGAKRRTRKTQKEFFLESNFGIDDLLKSGYVLFNDPVSKYVKEIANVLLESEPQLRKKLKFYVVRTPAVNAFATNQGIVLVNMGLISQLENEAQLAFILAHEISHYKEKHALEFYLESKSIDRKNSRGFLRRKSFDSTLAKNNFSKEQETEADALGLDIYLKSKYDLESVQGAFDVLKYSYLPFDEMAFSKSYFEDEYLIFPKNYQLDSIQAINTNMEDDDSSSTHPSLPKRRKAAKEIIGNTSPEGREKYIVSEHRFKELRKRSRYELLEYHLRSYEFYEAIYHSFLLEKKYPNDLYLKKIIGKALYGMTKFRNAKKFKDLEIDGDNVEGEFGGLVYFFNKLETYELNALALRYTYLLKDKFSDDPIWNEMVEDICQDLINKHSGALKRFKKGKPNLMVKKESIKAPVEEASEEEKSKYEKIRKKKKEDAESIFVHHAFGDLLEQDDFNSMMERCQAEKKKRKKEEDEDFSSNSFWETVPLASKGDYALGEKKVLVINPFYMKLKKGFKEPYLIQTEKSQIEFNQIIQENAQRLKLKIVMLDSENFGKNDVEQYNDLMVIQEWFGHQMEMDEELQMIAFNQESVNQIANKYGVDTFVWTGVVTGKVPKNLYAGYFKLLFNQISWIYGLVTPKGESIIFSFVINVATGQSKMTTFDLVPFVDHKDILKQRVYDILWQINKKQKK